MEDAFKRLLYAGFGLASQVTERFEKEIDELVEKGKVSDSEGKKIVDDFLEKTEARREEFEDRFKSFAEKLGYKKGGTATTEIEELKSRIEALEAKVNATKKTTTTKKAAATA